MSTEERHRPVSVAERAALHAGLERICPLPWASVLVPAAELGRLLFGVQCTASETPDRRIRVVVSTAVTDEAIEASRQRVEELFGQDAARAIEFSGAGSEGAPRA